MYSSTSPSRQNVACLGSAQEQIPGCDLKKRELGQPSVQNPRKLGVPHTVRLYDQQSVLECVRHYQWILPLALLMVRPERMVLLITATGP